MPSRKKLSERSNATLGDILKHPDRKVGPSDLASAGICGSYSTLGAWIEKGWLPEPHIMPNGQKFWFGSEIAAALGLGPPSNGLAQHSHKKHPGLRGVAAQ